MTWHADQTENRPKGTKLEKLHAERESLLAQIQKLAGQPIGKSEAARKGRQEDLIALAHKIKLIDTKLGRV